MWFWLLDVHFALNNARHLVNKNELDSKTIDDAGKILEKNKPNATITESTKSTIQKIISNCL